MKTPFRLERLVGLAVLGLAGSAGAQAAGPDMGTATPDVMLLVDTSGSMELTVGGTVPKCDPTNPNTGVNDTNEKSRWINLIEVLTGTINKYSCFGEPRNSVDFKQEFAIGAGLLPPPDYNYLSFDYHRPLSNLCAPGAGDMPSSAPWAWPSGAQSAVKYRPYAGGTITAASSCSSWSATGGQVADGLLDAYRGAVRFGLMTFDTEADAGTGVKNPNLTNGIVDGTEDDQNGIRGTWSYYLSSGTGCHQKSSVSSGAQCKSNYPNGSSQDNPGGCCMGGPLSCTALSPWEAGARNAAAPPWEGRMVAFGPSGEDGKMRIDWIKDILRSTRPYSSTPVAGMLNDARDFFWNDATKDPLNQPNAYFGPSKDTQVQPDMCRNTVAILLTDGEPNMDLRTQCEGLPKDKCPYDKAEDIVKDLANPTGTQAPVRTYVVGFALDKVKIGGVDVDCRTLDPSTDPLCVNPTDPALKVCCRLNNIAWNGTPLKVQTQQATPTSPAPIKFALFAQTPGDLRTAMTEVLNDAGQDYNRTRTYPISVVSALGDTTKSGVPGSDRIAGYEVTSGYSPDLTKGGGFRGVLGRNRLVCVSQVAEVQPFDAKQGDDFVANVNKDPTKRLLFTIQPPSSASAWDPTVSIRPYFNDASLDDGVHLVGGAQSTFLAPSALKGVIKETTIGATAGSCTPAAATAALCKDTIVNFMSGLPTATPFSRCPSPDTDKCDVVGDIMHSTPQVQSGIPSEFLRDSTYAAFATSLAQRDGMVYVSTNDGFFHGFWLYPGDRDSARQIDAKKPNEQFAFIPPAVLPSFVTQYPTQIVHQTPAVNRSPELDGSPVIRDVAATQGGTPLNNSSSSPAYYPYWLERKKTPAANETNTWRTVMAQAFGSRRGGYFAVDVTVPNIVTGNTSTGPKFLWQLTRDSNGKEIFGRASPSPLITTLFVDLKNLGRTGETKLEVPVAVLPGGTGDSPSDWSPSCNNKIGTIVPIDSAGTTGRPTAYRTSLPCYNTAASVAARSLTIVRLDNGMVLRTFRPDHLPTGVTTPVTFDTKVLTLTDIPAPIVGQAAAYPAGAGQVADRIFVGDQEGRLWRIDVSNPDPALWTMNVFFDAYWDLPSTTTAQPALLQPVLGVDSTGQITVAYATGDQDNLANVDKEQDHVVSLTESVTVSGGAKVFNSKFNWRHKYQNGEKVVGPMALFDHYVYFTTYVPPGARSNTSPAGACIAGDSYINAEQYTLPSGDATVKPMNSSASTDAGGKAVSSTWPILVEATVATGAAIRQRPSCASGVASTSSTDDFLGYGKTTSVTSVSPGAFEVFIQKSGKASGGTASGTGGEAPKTAIATQSNVITSPRVPVRVDSWAPIIE